MKARKKNHERLLELINGLMDGWIDDAEQKELQEYLKQSASARELYRQQMELHARLHLDHSGGLVPELMRRQPIKRQVLRFPWGQLAAAMAASILIALLLFWPKSETGKHEFAHIESTSGARWESTQLPTAAGSQLGPGTLHLIEGLATVVFDSGAKVTIEAPSELVLIDKMHCRLIEGLVIADVPESAIGFKISTPSVDVIDHGTRFSVIVDAESRETSTKVYQGMVEVQHPLFGQSLKIREGEFNAAGLASLGEVRAFSDQPFGLRQIGPPRRGDDWRRLTTSRDAYIGRAFVDGREVHRSETLLLVKNGSVMRHAYLGFDLTDYGANTIIEAELALEFAPSGWGFASLVPDATFLVFGVTGDPVWDEETLDLGNAPASHGRELHLDRERLVELGSFVIPHGIQKGRYGIEDRRLADFLSDHAGRPVTLLVVRETAELEDHGLVHGFASRRHPNLPGPILSIRLAQP